MRKHFPTQPRSHLKSTGIPPRRGNRFCFAQAQYPLVISKLAEKDEALSSTGASSQKHINFRWEDTHIEQLIDEMITYKVEMSYKGLDFESRGLQLSRQGGKISAYKKVKNCLPGKPEIPPYRENAGKSVSLDVQFELMNFVQWHCSEFSICEKGKQRMGSNVNQELIRS